MCGEYGGRGEGGGVVLMLLEICFHKSALDSGCLELPGVGEEALAV